MPVLQFDGQSDFNSRLISETLQTHSAYQYVVSTEKLQLFGKYHIFVIWNKLQIWKSLEAKLPTLHKTANASLTDYFCKNPTYATAAPAFGAQEPALSAFNTVARQAPSDLAEQHYEFWSKLGTSLASLKMLQTWLNQNSRPCPPLSPLNLSTNLTSFVRHTLDSTLDLLPHELAVNLFISSENLKRSREAALAYYNSASFPKVVPPLHSDSSQALELLRVLCGDDDEAWQEVACAARTALKAHTKLWDEMENELKYYNIFNNGNYNSDYAFLE